jgi:hypothetical protein
MGSGPVKVRIEVDAGQKVEFGGGRLETLKIDSIFPGSTFTGDRITITGSGFVPESQVLLTQSGYSPVLGAVFSQLDTQLVFDVPWPPTTVTQYDPVTMVVRVKNSETEFSNEISVMLYKQITKGNAFNDAVESTGSFDNPFRTPVYIFRGQQGSTVSLRAVPIQTPPDTLHPTIQVWEVIPHDAGAQYAWNSQKIAEHMTLASQVQTAEILDLLLPSMTNYVVVVDGVCFAPGPGNPVTVGPFMFSIW